MKTQQETELRMFLMETVRQYAQREISPTDFLTLIETLHKKPEIATDTTLSNCATIADFFAKQITKGNNDLLSRELLDEAYAYIVKKLTAPAPVL
jgi:hypothetical protein